MNKGIDISSVQGNVDFNQVKQSGYQFVITKATEGSEAGSRYLNPFFKQSITKANAAGLMTHAYHYFRGISESDARAEAQWFLKNLKGVSVKGYLFIDVEDKNLNENPAVLTSYVNAFLDELARSGYTKLGVYSGLYFMKDQLVEPQLRAGLLKWIAQYNSTFSRSADIWQHTSQARVPGVGGYVDENIAYTDKVVSGQAVSASQPVKTVQAAPVKTTIPNTYTIKSGDTLSGIGARFGIDYHVIKAINGLTSDTIYPNQVLRLKGTAAVPKPAASGTYTVQSGDNLTKIAAAHGTTFAVIASLNGLSNPYIIQPGQVLKLPGTASSPVYHTVVQGDTVSELAKQNGVSIGQIKAWNHLDSRYTIYIGKKIRVR